MALLRVIGDIHAQVDFTVRPGRPSYLELIADCPCSVQLGDMGDGETYAELASQVDPTRHRFFPGNHDHYNCLPADHCLGDFGEASLADVRFFFVRGAASSDKQKLLERGGALGKKLWFEEEELNEDEMSDARQLFASARPVIMMSHDAPARIAHFISADLLAGTARFQASRTAEFLESLWAIHRPVLWLFGHYHRDWEYVEDGTRFRCVGELSFADIDERGRIAGRP